MVHLPALNTPQFDWVEEAPPRSRSPCRRSSSPRWPPRDPPRRPPPAAARVLGRSGRPSRRSSASAGPGLATATSRAPPSRGRRRPTSRCRPPAARTTSTSRSRATHGAHGPFDDRAHGRSVQFWLSKNRGWLLGAAAIATSAAGIGAPCSRKRSGERALSPPSHPGATAASSRSCAGSQPADTRPGGGKLRPYTSEPADPLRGVGRDCSPTVALRRALYGGASERSAWQALRSPRSIRRGAKPRRAPQIPQSSNARAVPGGERTPKGGGRSTSGFRALTSPP